MPAESKSLSEFPRALEVLSGALLLISNPSGQDSFDTNSALLTEVAQAMLDVHYTQELGDVSVFDAIKNCRVLSGTTTPTSALGVDGQLYIKYETTGGVDEVVAMYFKKSSAWLEISLGGGNTDYIECTQAQYDAWEQGGTLDPDTLYFITDGQAGGATELADLTDVDITTPTDGQLLRYNGTSGKWENSGVSFIGNPPVGKEYHFELESGWSCPDFYFSRQGNKCTLTGQFIKTSAISTWQFIGRFPNLPNSKSIKPATEVAFILGADTYDVTPYQLGITRCILRSTDGYLQTSNDMPTAKRIYVNITWIAQTSEE